MMTLGGRGAGGQGGRKRLRREGETCDDNGYLQRNCCERDVCEYWQRGNVRKPPFEALSLIYVRD